MKRTVLLLFALTLLSAIPLAGCGLTHAAGSVLLGGGGLSMVLMVALAFMGARGAARAPLAAAVAPEAPAARAEPGVEARVEREAITASRVEPKAAAVAPAAAVASRPDPKKGKLTKSQRRATAKARAKAAQATPARPRAVVVEVAPEARAPGIEEVAAFFVKAAVKNAEPANDGFAADELAFFAEGENQAMRASDSSPHWHVGQL